MELPKTTLHGHSLDSYSWLCLVMAKIYYSDIIWDTQYLVWHPKGERQELRRNPCTGFLAFSPSYEESHRAYSSSRENAATCIWCFWPGKPVRYSVPKIYWELSYRHPLFSMDHISSSVWKKVFNINSIVHTSSLSPVSHLHSSIGNIPKSQIPRWQPTTNLASRPFQA